MVQQTTRFPNTAPLPLQAARRWLCAASRSSERLLIQTQEALYSLLDIPYFVRCVVLGCLRPLLPPAYRHVRSTPTPARLHYPSFSPSRIRRRFSISAIFVPWATTYSSSRCYAHASTIHRCRRLVAKAPDNLSRLALLLAQLPSISLLHARQRLELSCVSGH